LKRVEDQSGGSGRIPTPRINTSV